MLGALSVSEDAGCWRSAAADLASNVARRRT
jgi:hypothetical protein